jgi:MFS family permease
MKVSKNKRILFYFVTMMYWFSMYTYVPILSPYVEDMGGSLFVVGLVIASYGFTQMLVRIPLGIWSDRLQKRKTFIIAGLVIATLSSLGFALTSNVWFVLGFRSLAGIAAASWVAFTVLFASYFNSDEAPRAMGVISFFTSLGQMFATTSGGFLADYYGWNAPFIVAAIVGVIGIVLATKLFETNTTTTANNPVTIHQLLSVGKERQILAVSVLAVLAQCVTFTTMFGFTPLHAVAIGASKSDLSILIFFSTIPNAIAGYISGGIIARKIGERNTVMIGFIIAAVCTIALPFTNSLSLLIITQAFNGFGQGLVMPVLMGLAIKTITEDRRASAMGFFQAIYSLGMFGGPFIAGWVGNAIGLSGGFIIIGFISVLAAVLARKWIVAKTTDIDPVLQKDRVI